MSDILFIFSFGVFHKSKVSLWYTIVYFRKIFLNALAITLTYVLGVSLLSACRDRSFHILMGRFKGDSHGFLSITVPSAICTVPALICFFLFGGCPLHAVRLPHHPHIHHSIFIIVFAICMYITTSAFF
jgi:hypothetical protein